MPDEDMERHRVSFDDAVQLYERARPSYPVEAVRWMVGGDARDVVDLGAGTGKLTRVAVEAGYAVTAIEPLAGMRAELSRQLPGLTALAGSAEEIPLPDRSVDALLVAQAWHWFDETRAVPEIARVLRPGGALGIVRNDMDDRVPWVRRMRELTKEVAGPVIAQEEDANRWSPPLEPEFGPPEWTTFEHALSQDLDTLLAGLASRSYFITMRPEERDALLADVGELLRTDPDTRGRDTYELPFVTYCMRAIRIP
jgi:SAM-dependent methyltransferase